MLRPHHSSGRGAGGATLYFHYPCFDGLVSCVLAWDFLERKEGWNRVRFCPVNYEIRESWLATDLRAPCAVVDFLYHPQASFWADHHLTSFATRRAKDDFELRKEENCLLFDDNAKSCASLLWAHLHRHLSDKKRYAEMVSWAEKIDSATYSCVNEAILGDSPAIQINLSLMFRNGADYPRLLVKELRSKNLAHVADLPAVQSRYTEVRRRISAGLIRMRERAVMEDGDVVFFDVEARDDEIVSRYSPYYFFPKARYSIGVVRSNGSVRITAMRNPWRNFRSIPLGKLFEPFGGGGHERVGSVVIPSRDPDRVRDLLNRLRAKMQARSVRESIIA